MKTVSRTVAFIELTGRPSAAGDGPTVIFSGLIMHRQSFVASKLDAGALNSTSPILRTMSPPVSLPTMVASRRFASPTKEATNRLDGVS